MATRITYKGAVYEAPENPLFGEIRWVEKQFDKNFEDFSGTEQIMASILFAMRRVDAKAAPSVAQLEDLGLDDFEIEEDPRPAPVEVETEPDPTGDAQRTGPRSASGESLPGEG